MAPSKKSVKQATETTATPPEPVPVVENTTVEIIETEADKYDVVIEKLQNMIIDAKDMLATVKTLKKEYAKAKSSGRKRRVANDGSKRPASGITKPTELSNELCDFLGLPHGTQKARTDVTKMINSYIKNNKLQDEKDRRTIIPDKKLQGILLPVPSDKKLSFFNMQSFIRQHFKKIEA